MNSAQTVKWQFDEFPVKTRRRPKHHVASLNKLTFFCFFSSSLTRASKHTVIENTSQTSLPSGNAKFCKQQETFCPERCASISCLPFLHLKCYNFQEFGAEQQNLGAILDTWQSGECDTDRRRKLRSSCAVGWKEILGPDVPRTMWHKFSVLPTGF